MAHADYNCCAVCDSKLEYSNDARTKEEICSWCAVNLAQDGVFVHDVDELKKWMREENPLTIVTILIKNHFSTCYYKNEVDDLFKAAQQQVQLTNGRLTQTDG
jgi:hypothetical protein